jgi:hypothetical protein
VFAILAEICAWFDSYLKKKLEATQKLQEKNWKFVMGSAKTNVGRAT